MATRKTNQTNKGRDIRGSMATSDNSGVNSVLDDAERASNVALGAAAIAVLAIALFAVPIFDMYLTVKTSDKSKTVYVEKVEKLEDKIKVLEKQLKEKQDE
jgi:hypothetical protein